jgi:hypothetical protein
MEGIKNDRNHQREKGNSEGIRNLETTKSQRKEGIHELQK